MTTLIKKELSLLFCSSSTMFFVVGFLLVTGLINWVFPGGFNVIDNGYARLYDFFRLAPVVFIVLIPALTMRSFSEEIKSKNLEVFRTRPKSIANLYVSKLISVWCVVFLTLASTFIYVYTIYVLSNPGGNVDFNEIIASYTCLFFFSLIFISIGLFSSSLTQNQIVAFIIGIFLNFLLFYGFDLLSGLFDEARTQLAVRSVGLSFYYEWMQKGVLQMKDIFLLFNYVFIFAALSVFVLNHKNTRTKRSFFFSILAIIGINIVVFFVPDHRFDFTSDKRYTMSDYTKSLLKKVSDENKSIQINIYLDGDLNSGFQNLQNKTNDLLLDMVNYSNGHITYKFVNPHTLYNAPSETYAAMEKQQMKGVVLNEVDREGKASQKVIYPYAQLLSGGDTLQINLLKNISGYSAEENLNASAENLEFEFVNAIRQLNQKEAESIAFIEGHGEISRAYVYDAEELLSKYFFVNRGQIGHDISILDEFKVIIVAGPTQRFTEAEKFILDQYIMGGGKILWLIDGVYLSESDLKEKGQSPSMKNETNLDDLLFIYGIRINPVLIQDTQCSSIYLTSGDQTANSQYVERSWYYAPLLLPSTNHPVTKDISLVKTVFASYLDITDKSETLKKEVLLTTSSYSHIVETPEMVSLNLDNIELDKNYFNHSFLPVAAALTGKFRSAFENRLIPDSVSMGDRQFKKESVENTKMIIASSSEIIRNDLVGHDDQTQIIPMGYDRVLNRQFGNRDFIVNAVNWLAGDDNSSILRTKHQQIRLLNKQLAYTNRNWYVAVNVVVPLLVSMLFIAIFFLYRRRRYEK